MCRLIAIVLAALLGSVICLGEARSQSTSPRVENDDISKEILARLSAAMVLYQADQPKAALDTLGDYTKDERTPWQVRVFIGELYEKTEDFINAARFYQSIVDELGAKVNDLPGNLFFRLGTVAFEIKDYARAASSLELAFQYRGYQDDSRIFSMLAIAYRQLDRTDMADRAHLLHAAANPKASVDIVAINPAAWTADRSPLPMVPAHAMLREILVAPAPSDRPTESNFPLSGAALRYSEALDGQGWTRAAESYRRASIDLVFKDALTAIADDSDRQLHELARVSALPGYPDLPLKIRRVGFELEIQVHVNAGRYSHAAAALERSVVSGAYTSSEVADTATNLQRLAFAHVSFDPQSGLPRSKDPRKFLDTSRLVAAAEKAKGRRPSLSPKERGDRAKSPYSQLSHTEDWAEIGSAVVTASMYPAVERELISIIERCIDERSFELPVKFSLHLFASGFLDQKVKGKTTLRNRLHREISSDLTPRPEAATLDAYNAGEKLKVLMRRGAESNIKSQKF
jgi:Flp pilus assembly protein TadD